MTTQGISFFIFTLLFINVHAQVVVLPSFQAVQHVNRIPALTTTSASYIIASTATSGGNITSDGGSTVISRGVCWNTLTGPTIANSKTTDGSGIGIFSSYLTSLSPSTTYYVRAYATNGSGTSYGSEVSFTTLATMTFSNGGNRIFQHVESGASITVNNLVYVFAGYENHTAGSPYLWTYTLETDTWTQKANAPIGRTCVPLAYNSTDGKIYTFGGNVAGDDYNNLHRYDISTNTWEQVCANVPGVSARRGSSLGIINNKLYILGGWEDASAYFSQCYCYDIAANTTSSLASMPIATAVSQIYCQLGNYVYIAGGGDNATVQTKFQRYDMSSNTWIRLADLPEPRGSCGTPLLYYNGGLYILSGSTQTTCLRYDIAGDTWSTYSTNVTARSNHWAGVSTIGKAMIWGPDNLQTQICTLP